MEYIKKLIDKRLLHKREYDSRVNERQMQTKERHVDTSKALDASLFITESSEITLKKQDTSSRPGNDADANEADIKPVYDEEPMAEVNSGAKVPSYNATYKKKPIEQLSIAKKPERQIPTGHSSSFETHDHINEPSSSKLVPNVTPSADKRYSSQQELDFLFSPLYTRPPMLDRTDFASWQQWLRLYSRGKDNGVNILKSIDEGPYKLGTFRETLAESTEGTPQFGLERPRLPKEIYTLINHYTDAKDIWDNVKMLLEGSELTKEDRESQLYDDFKHFRQHKKESINDYYVRFSKLINDMRNIKMTMPKLQLNSNCVNNMLPEWGRFVTTVKLNRGLRGSNYDQLFAYLKQHEARANENKMVLKRLSQPIAQPITDPLAFTLALLTQSYKTFLPQTNNQLRTSSNPKNQAIVQDGRVVVQNVHGRPNRGQGMNPWGGNAVGYGEAQNRVRNVNQGQARTGQARTVKCYNCNGTGHITRNYTQPKRPQNSEYFMDKMLMMHAQENGVPLDAEQLLFLAGGPDNTFNDDVDEQPVQDLALNVENVFQAEDCDAFDSDVDEAPTAQTMFMANLSSADPIIDKAGPSYDSDILSE
nr:integrase, catalytic region, zinc finger, CCHC-type, peptidase aspartic, catalytic [Tanacetum cinerariifolium]